MNTPVTQQSHSLSQRSSQPGNQEHRNIWLFPEQQCYDLLREVINEQKLSDIFDVFLKPRYRQLIGLYGTNTKTQKDLGIIPDVLLVNKHNNRIFIFEVKYQKERGNAEERSYKYFTQQFMKNIQQLFHLPYHPFMLVFCGHLADDERYTKKFSFHLDNDQYILWKKNHASREIKEQFINKVFIKMI